MVKCTSCKKESEEGIKLVCPRCAKALFRCARCRSLSVEYKCQCGFQGP